MKIRQDADGLSGRESTPGGEERNMIHRSLHGRQQKHSPA
jgi:hypothetical protein